MSNQIHIIQNAITTTISEIFRGDFRRICEVKKAVLHLEAIYFCHGTCYLLKRENMPIKDQLALYQRIELIPQSTTEFFENNRECIINNWPEESALAAKPSFSVNREASSANIAYVFSSPTNDTFRSGCLGISFFTEA